MDAVERMRRAIARVSYKPGWTLTVFSLPTYGADGALGRGLSVSIHGSFPVPDANNPASLITVAFWDSYEASDIENFSDQQILKILRDCVRRAELHEVDEWFRVDGKCLRDPHRETAAT